MNRSLFLFICLQPFVMPALQAESQLKDPQRWLGKMNDALQSVSYRGTFVYLHDNQLEAMQITHRVDEGGERERLYSLNGAAREVVRENELVKCFLPDDKAVLVEKGKGGTPFPQALPTEPGKLAGNYSFIDLGYGRIAGHYCKFIGIKPKDGYRYGYRICIDKQTGLPLKSELISETGETVEQVMFTHLSIEENITDSELTSSESGEGFKWLVSETDEPGEEGAIPEWQVREMPPGFAFSSAQSKYVDAHGKHANQVIFSDGLASVSVFAEPAENKKPGLEGLSKIGAVNAFGMRIDGHQITVVGEVPPATVEMIGRSIEFDSLANR
ncbi:MAG: MucB/RseB C-terminal domain-containing protein [Gammaproteobacteria bacterium]|nr:MucB/RseB C-terminal domain-containing protein [Gammaproteobacteria bacterium]